MKYHEGLSHHQISTNLKIGSNQVNFVLNGFYDELNFGFEDKETSQEQDGQSTNEKENVSENQKIEHEQMSVVEEIFELKDQNFKPVEIARRLGLDLNFVNGIINDNISVSKPEKLQEARQMSRPWSKKDVRFLLENYDKMTPGEIGEKLERSRGAVRTKKHKIKRKNHEMELKSDIVSKLANPELLVLYESDLQKEIVRLHISELRGMKNIGKVIKSDPRTFKQVAYKYGLDITKYGKSWIKIKKHYAGQFNLDFPQYMREIITGSLLGDMNIRLQSKSRHYPNQPALVNYKRMLEEIEGIRNKIKHSELLTVNDVVTWNEINAIFHKLNVSSFRVHKSIFELEWVKLLKDEFKKGYSTTGFIKPIKKGVRPDRLKWSCGFDTESSFQLFKIWLEWYTKNDKKVDKILPDTFKELTPNILLHWFIGDGTNSSGTLALYTFGFSLNDQKRLQTLFLNIGVETEIIRKRGKYYINIVNTDENRGSFYQYMSSAKFYDKAKELLPHKFDGDVRRRDIIKKLRRDHPEYFDSEANLSWEYYYKNGE